MFVKLAIRNVHRQIQSYLIYIEIPILKGSKIAGKKLWELNVPKEIIIGCILRGDQSLIPRGDTRIIEGDVLLIITSDRSKLEEIKELTEHAAS